MKITVTQPVTSLLLATQFYRGAALDVNFVNNSAWISNQVNIVNTKEGRSSQSNFRNLEKQ